MLESVLKKKVIDYLKKNSVYFFKTIASNRAGIPDIICCVNGKFKAIELKTTSKQSDLQKLEQVKIEKSGGQYLLLYHTDNWKEILSAYLLK